MCDIYIIYPERRWISEQKLASWYADAVANMEAEPGARTVREMAAALEDIGFITRAEAPLYPQPEYVE